MKKLPLFTLVFTLTHTVLAQNFNIYNAASLTAGSIAPGTIAAIKGNDLTTKVDHADDAQNPPTSLDGVTVTIGGTAAALFYVSPSQINLLVDPKTPTGSQQVVVTSPAGTQNGTVTIDMNAPPGLFSLFGTGTRDGAILNAITFDLGDFSTHNATSQTYLALFATGLNTSVKPTVTIGGIQVSVVFAGPASCCMGLEQVNVQLPDSLAGAGRVPVVLTANGQNSNTVQVVLLPPAGKGPFASDEDHGKRSRELSALASIPGTSLVLSADQNDDVVRVIDVKAKQVLQVITLPDGAGPVALAVDSTGKIAVVAESDLGSAAILDLSDMKNVKIMQVPTDMGPNAVAISGTQAFVVNGDVDSVSIIDLTTDMAHKPIMVGHGPEAVAADKSNAYVVNENDGSLSVINLGTLAVTTVPLDKNLRPESIVLVPNTTVAYLTVPAAGPDGQVLEVDLTTGHTLNTISANPDRSGGSSAALLFGSNLYFANQTGGSVSVLALKANGDPNGSPTTIKVDLGARALAVDATDNLLVVSNEGSGTLVLVDLASGNVTGRIKAVQTNLDGDDGADDHSDRSAAANLPSITSISPATGKAGNSFTLTVTGKNLTGATAVLFVSPMMGGGEDHGKGANPLGTNDPAFTVSAVQASPDGTQVTAKVAIGASATAGPRLVRVVTPNGTTAFHLTAAATFTVQ